MDLQAPTLDLWQKCPLLDFEVPEDKLLKTARSVLEWSLTRDFDGERPEKSRIREKFVSYWQQGWGNLPREGAAYWRGPKAAPFIAGRIHRMFDRVRVLLPPGPYQLSVSNGMIEGESAILVPRRSKETQAYVLVSWGRRPKQSQPPRLSTMAALLNAYELYEHRYPSIGAWHLPLLSGKSWQQERMDRSWAEYWVSQAVEAQSVTVPRYGAHCKDCSSKKCQEIYQ